MSQTLPEVVRAEAPREISGAPTPEDVVAEPSLRPRSLAEYIGQPKITTNLKIFLRAAKARREALDHVLFFGPPGLGKTTLSQIIAQEMNAPLKTVSAPAIERGGDLAAVLTNLQEGEVLFIDEIHRLKPQIEEVLYPAMEDYQLDIMIGQGRRESISKTAECSPWFGRRRAGAHHRALRGRSASYSTGILRAEDLEIHIHAAEIMGVGSRRRAAELARALADPRTQPFVRRVRDYARPRQGPHHEGVRAARSRDGGCPLRHRQIDRKCDDDHRKFDGGPRLGPSPLDQRGARKIGRSSSVPHPDRSSTAPRGRVCTPAATPWLRAPRRQERRHFDLRFEDEGTPDSESKSKTEPANSYRLCVTLGRRRRRARGEDRKPPPRASLGALRVWFGARCGEEAVFIRTRTKTQHLLMRRGRLFEVEGDVDGDLSWSALTEGFYLVAGRAAAFARHSSRRNRPFFLRNVRRSLRRTRRRGEAQRL